MKLSTVNDVREMDDATLIESAWQGMTNRHDCGGFSAKGRALASRRLRAMGAKFWLARFVDTDEDGNERGVWQWGMYISPIDRPRPTGMEEFFEGNSLNHCAHKLGNGDAKAGWRIYFGN